jgi:hypothetical protein
MLLGALALSGGAFLIGEHVAFGQRRFRHCVQCRVLEIDHSYLGWHWQTRRENEHTAWYRAQGPANHGHVWVGGSTPISWQNWRGKTIGAGSKLENGVMTILSPAEQTLVYERIGNLGAADAYFAQLRHRVDPDPATAAMIAHALKRWVAEAPQETTWEAWRQAIEADYRAGRSRDTTRRRVHVASCQPPDLER